MPSLPGAPSLPLAPAWPAGPCGPAGPGGRAVPLGPAAPSVPRADEAAGVKLGRTVAGKRPSLPSGRSVPAFGVREALMPPTRVAFPAFLAKRARLTVLAA